VREDGCLVDLAVFLDAFQIVRQPVWDTEIDSFVVVEVVTTVRISIWDGSMVLAAAYLKPA
jgi:hypothetical protein